MTKKNEVELKAVSKKVTHAADGEIKNDGQLKNSFQYFITYKKIYT